MSQHGSGAEDRSNPGQREPGSSADEAVLAYLAAIEAHRVAPETLPHPDISAGALAGADMVHGDDGGEELATELARHTPGSEDNIRALEDAFVADAADYGRRHHVSYQGWIEAGVEARVLDRAGVAPDDG
jgi:hypothetical protein